MDDETYFEQLEEQLDDAFEIAEEAKALGEDPSPDVEIPVAKDMADRVENILGIEGVAARVRELEGEMSREEAALALVTDFVEGTVGDYDSRAGKVEGAVRTAVALLTEGVVAAPIEGIDRVELLENDDGTEFINIYYAGPIRSAGGTAQALSVLVGDYARALLGIEEYNARTAETERYAEEIALYDKETGLQYTPKDPETKFIAKHLPVMLDGEPTGDEEVSGFRDLERVATNSARGGMCLVLAEGIALKAPKIQRYTRQLDEIDWPWLQDLIDGSYAEGDESGDESEGETEAETDSGSGEERDDTAETPSEPVGPPRAASSGKFLRDLIAGRPVFGHPSESGGFRLRYGRARNHGFATAGVHPATMRIVDDFLATGTQIKTERPGKAAGVIPVDSIDGPTVKLANGDVRRIDDPAEANEIANGVVEILDLGEYLVNYGEFVENNHPLAPASYVTEWWRQDLAAAGADVQALADDPGVSLDRPTAERALAWASEYDAPLHPAYTYLWHDLSVEAFEELAATVAASGRFAETDGGLLEASSEKSRPQTLTLPNTEAVTDALETIVIEHTQGSETVSVPDARPFVRSLGLTDDLDRTWESLSSEARTWADGENAHRAVAEVAPFDLRERAPTRIGNRMGRPEKSEQREMSPAVHTLFPIGEAGGSQRDVTGAAKQRDVSPAAPGEIDVEVARRRCPDCDNTTFRGRCRECGSWTDPHYVCPDCEHDVEPDESGRAECPGCETLARSTEYRDLDLNQELRDAHEAVGERAGSYEILKGVKGLTSNDKIPEPLEKGVLRAKNGVSSFEDGTVRYDMTDLPVTSVRAAELDVSVDQLRELGYETDIDGVPLRHDDQLVELRVQDVVLPDGAAEHMLRTADYVDDLLEQYYGLDAFYELDDRDDLVGELVFGMAPHTSAAVVGRVVGFTSAAVGYAHPYFHAAKRRNCFHPETKLWYRDETEEWHYGRIDEFVERRLDPATAREDDFGTLAQELDGDVFVPSVTDDGRETVKPVEAVSKHPAPAHMVRVETEGGRTLTVTPDHRLCRWNREVEKVEASEITVGDDLAVPTQRPTDRAEDPRPATADGGVVTDTVSSVETVQSDSEHTYCLTVADTHTLVANDTYVAQCDGDEDCVMLLMDGLLNFSKAYLPNQRGGRMDAPLVMSSRIDPSEIDDEAHNMDIVDRYPRKFYEATREQADPEDVDIQIAEDTLGTASEYSGFDHTHDTTDIALGPDLSAYKTLGSMTDKMDAQFALARKLRAVDETDVAERVIEYHFLPDLIGNLRAFSRQETRCLDCGEKYRRMPLTGDCRECGGRVNLTVHEGSVNKYMDVALRVAEEYGCREYTKQRLKILERSLESVFENDKNKQGSISDFM